ncbi:substrate-binding domain-containing protein [Neolewinella agarilytica]|uniref:substrate-binding domain-containing protein n=1 Tax=Neolewinella agarilytica TaxID=478744 RepID=UPI0023566E26|nr:substrate-binding domain-containing protein [Neolewinella agarilytica]
MRYLLVTLIAIGVFTSCTSTTGENTSVDTIKVGFSQCCDDGWRDIMNQEVKRESSLHPELSLTLRTSANNSELQIQHIEEFIEEKVDVLLVSPNESAPLTPVIEKAYNAGIQVVLIDRKIESNLYTAYIGADNFEIGRTAGTYLSGKFPEGGKIMTIELPETISPGVDRAKGFVEGISENPGFIIDQVVRDHTVINMPDSFRRLVSESQDIDIVFSHTDYLAEVAHSIARETDLADSIFFIGIDGIPGTGRGIEAVEDGILNASVLYPTGGDEAVRLIVAIVQGLPYQKENTLETIVIEPGNAVILSNQMKRVSKLQEMIDEEVERLDRLRVNYQSQRLLISILLIALLIGLVLAVSLIRSLWSKQRAYTSLREKNQEILENQKQLHKLAEQLDEADEIAFNEDKPFDVTFFITRIREMLQERKNDVQNAVKSNEIVSDQLSEVLKREDLPPEDLDFLRRIADYVETHYEDSTFKATDLCQELGVSRSHLYRKVKELLNEGVTSYVESVRLRKAQFLLRQTDKSIADIAYAVGYSTPEYFAKVFKSRFHTSPTGFRENKH